MSEPRAYLRTKSNNREKPGRWAQIRRLGIALALACATVASAQTYRVLKNFTGGSDGGTPRAGLTLAGATLYGTADGGGTEGKGVVFKVNTDGSGYAVLKSFTGSEGWMPYADLVVSGSTLYGTTVRGGSWDVGVVFKLNTDGSGYTVLKSFTGSDGGYPWMGLILAGGSLYGTTTGGTEGYDVVFKVSTDGSGYKVLKSFTRSGEEPRCGLVLADGALYGTTIEGGGSNYGVVFRMNTDGSGYRVLKNFTPSDGTIPWAGLLLAGSTLYGTTEDGGNWNSGVVFKLNTDESGYTVLKNFTGGDGANPQGGLVLAGSTIYGTTSWGGSMNCGVVFSLACTSCPPGVSIISGPSTQTAEIGTTPCFEVELTNSPPEATYYRWYFNGIDALAGGTNSHLYLTNVQPPQAGAYTVVITNLAGEAATSAPAMLQVITPVERRPVAAIDLMGDAGSLLNLDYADSIAPAPNWMLLDNVSLVSTSQWYFDITAPLPPWRFYRVWQTGPPRVLPSLSLPGMVPAITLTGNIGASLRLDYIKQFGPIDAWVTLDTVTLINTSQLYFDTSSIGQPARLWRIVPVP